MKEVIKIPNLPKYSIAKSWHMHFRQRVGKYLIITIEKYLDVSKFILYKKRVRGDRRTTMFVSSRSLNKHLWAEESVKSNLSYHDTVEHLLTHETVLYFMIISRLIKKTQVKYCIRGYMDVYWLNCE